MLAKFGIALPYKYDNMYRLAATTMQRTSSGRIICAGNCSAGRLDAKQSVKCGSIREDLKIES